MAEHKISDEVMANTELLAKLALTDEEREKSRQEMEKILGMAQARPTFWFSWARRFMITK